MKRSPDMARLEEVLRSSKLVAGGFLGTDHRPLEEIIGADAATLMSLDRTIPELATRMWEITDRAKQGLEMTVPIDETLEARVMEARGQIPCPWPHDGRYAKTVVEARQKDTGLTIQWTELNIHLIESHGFFEGKGSPFRVDPERLVRVIF